MVAEDSDEGVQMSKKDKRRAKNAEKEKADQG